MNTDKMTRPMLASMLLASAVVATGAATPASAGAPTAAISFVNMFRSDSHTQTGNGNVLTSDGSFLTLGLFAANPNDFTSAQTTFTGPPSPAVLTSTIPGIFGYSTGFYPTRAAMNADFPAGTYTYTATNGSTTDQTSILYSTDAFPSTVPFLTGTDYADLQGVNPAAPFAFHFSPDTPAPTASEALLFFTVFDAVTGDVIFDSGSRPATTTGLTLPANTLVAGKQYAYELIFSDRVTVASPGADFDGQIGFDLRTSGTFTTAVAPEPASLLLAAAGTALLRRRRSR